MNLALAVVGGVAFLSWLAVLAHPARPWDLRPQGDDGRSPEPAVWPGVCVLVPAHDEAAVLPLTLPALLAQDYPGSWRIVVVDDRSTDGTGEVARRHGSERLAVVEGGPLQDGWVGKVWALEQGFAHTGDAEYVLLTDADILHEPSNLRALVAESEEHRLALDSRMARLHVEGLTERLLVPPFAFFFALLYPMRWANDSRRRVAAAAGGCILVRRSVLMEVGGFAAIRGEVIDDVNLAVAVKRLGLPIRLAVSREHVRSVRSYRTPGAFWRTVRRTAFTQLGCSWLLLVATTVALVALFAAPPALVAVGLSGAGGALGPVLGAAAWLTAAVVYLPTVRFYRLFPLWALTLPLAGLLYGAMTIDSALKHARNERPVW
jgi:hopene-associated glycosyltransferase HpnB